MAKEVGDLGITAQLENSLREVEVPFETLTISFMQLVLQVRQLDWCLLHGWSQYFLCGSACLKCQCPLFLYFRSFSVGQNVLPPIIASH